MVQPLVQFGQAFLGVLKAGLLLGQGPGQGLPDALGGVVNPGEPNLPEFPGDLLEALMEIPAQTPAMFVHQFQDVFLQFFQQLLRKNFSDPG